MKGTRRLTEFEAELVQLGISAANAFSLPKSVGAIFGLIFSNAAPLALDDCIEKLEISKGSASQGLKFLQRMGAIKPVYGQRSTASGKGSPTDSPAQSADRRFPRKTYYEPEISLRRLLIGILNENIMPHLKQSGEQVGKLRDLLEEGMGGSERETLEERLQAIETWGKKGRLILPVMERVLRAPMKR